MNVEKNGYPYTVVRRSVVRRRGRWWGLNGIGEAPVGLFVWDCHHYLRFILIIG